MKKRIFVCCMLLALLANSCGAAWAETEAAYADLNGAVQTQTGMTWIGQDTVLWSGGWYAVSGACTIEERVTAEGAVNLILRQYRR